MKKKTAVFIDGSNLFYIEKSLNFNISFKRFAEYLNKTYDIYNMFYYTGINLDDKKETDFLDDLTMAGYTVRQKALKIIRTGPREEDIVKKANLDIEIVVDMINTVDHYDRLILISGDSDFVRALELIRSHGKEIWVISQKGHIAKELINVADKYIDIEKLKQFIQRGRPKY
ncbi:NYN domain-containing protein [Patescibacteria group bacterium]|nr:NYN domain-containing protein [Patescibacteria group bacterium]